MDEENSIIESTINEGKAAGDKLFKVKSLKRFGAFYFIMGFVACIIITSIVFFLILGGRFVSKDQAEYYEGLDDEYGKNYQMETLLKKQALYDCNTDGLSEYLSYAIVSCLEDDKYAAYFTKEELEQFEKVYVDSYTGIGVGITQDESGQIVIEDVLEGGSAENAGIKAGDIIVKINGKKPESSDEAVELIQGDLGNKVEMSIKRDGNVKEYELFLTEVSEESVDYSVYDKDKGIGYVNIKLFKEGTADSVKAAVKDLKNKGCDKIIFDLRSNTGGITDEGIDVADYLLPSCTIMKEKIKGKKMKTHNSDESSCGVKYVLLVDGYTASASEIVTAAVKDNAGGKIIGSRTFGKGLIQSMREFKDGSAVKFTIGEYFSPNGTKINEVGIEPDIATDDPMSAAVQELTQ